MSNLALRPDRAETTRLRRMLAHRVAIALAMGHSASADHYARALALCPSGVWS